jgi:hypothetical protein
MVVSCLACSSNSEDGGDMFLPKADLFQGTTQNDIPGIELFVSTAVGTADPKLLCYLTLQHVFA